MLANKARTLLTALAALFLATVTEAAPTVLEPLTAAADDHLTIDLGEHLFIKADQAHGRIILIVDGEYRGHVPDHTWMEIHGVGDAHGTHPIVLIGIPSHDDGHDSAPLVAHTADHGFGVHLSTAPGHAPHQDDHITHHIAVYHDANTTGHAAASIREVILHTGPAEGHLDSDAHEPHSAHTCPHDGDSSDSPTAHQTHGERIHESHEAPASASGNDHQEHTAHATLLRTLGEALDTVHKHPGIVTNHERRALEAIRHHLETSTRTVAHDG